MYTSPWAMLVPISCRHNDSFNHIGCVRHQLLYLRCWNTRHSQVLNEFTTTHFTIYEAIYFTNVTALTNYAWNTKVWYLYFLRECVSI